MTLCNACGLRSAKRLSTAQSFLSAGPEVGYTPEDQDLAVDGPSTACDTTPSLPDATAAAASQAAVNALANAAAAQSMAESQAAKEKPQRALTYATRADTPSKVACAPAATNMSHAGATMPKSPISQSAASRPMSMSGYSHPMPPQSNHMYSPPVQAAVQQTPVPFTMHSSHASMSARQVYSMPIMGGGPMAQTGGGQMAQMGSGQMMQMSSGQMAHIGSGQMPQVSSGHSVHRASGQMAQMSSGQMAQMNPVQVTQMRSGQMNQVGSAMMNHSAPVPVQTSMLTASVHTMPAMMMNNMRMVPQHNQFVPQAPATAPPAGQYMVAPAQAGPATAASGQQPSPCMAAQIVHCM